MLLSQTSLALGSLAMLTACPSASSLVLPSTLDDKANLSYSNGHLSAAGDVSMDEAMISESESDLSEVPDQQHSTLPIHSSTKQPLHGDDRDAEGSILSDDGDVDMGSDDADFEVDSPAPQMSITRDVRSSSEESRRPHKRKAGIEDDQEIMNNPELYGIRRSVRLKHKGI